MDAGRPLPPAWSQDSEPLLLVCRAELTGADFARLEALLTSAGVEARWARRAGRLVLGLSGPASDPELPARLAADPAVEYALRGVSREELGRIFSRRDLLGVALVATGVMAAAVVGAPLALYLREPPGDRAGHGDVYVGELDTIPVNGAVSRVIDGEDFLIVRRDATHLHALAATCTHSNICLVAWDRRRQQLVCPCHRGVFDEEGNVVSGPPPRPLARREVVVRGQAVYVKGTGA